MSGTGNDAIGVALLGYGAIADMHARALRDAGARLMVVAGPNQHEAQAFAQRHGIGEVAATADEAIANEDVTVVVAASPSHVHADQAQAALEAGKHALIEIPLALTFAEAESLACLADRRGLTLGVCHTLRFWEPMLAVQDSLLPAAGRVRHVIARGLGLRRENVGWTGRRRSWTDDLLWHHGGHIVDAVVWFLGEPVTDIATEPGPFWERTGRPMDYSISLATAAGAIASIALSYNSRIGVSDYLILGDDATIVIDGATVRVSGREVMAEDAAAVQWRALASQDEAFLAAVRGDGAFAASAQVVLPAMHVLQAVQDVVDAARR